MTPGRLPSISTSTVSISVSASSSSSGRFRLRATIRFPRRKGPSESGRSGSPSGALLGRTTCDNLGAEIGEHAAGERTRADPLELDHLQTCKRMHREPPPRRLYTVT